MRRKILSLASCILPVACSGGVATLDLDTGDEVLPCPDEHYDMVSLPAGRFTMGSPEDEVGRRSDESQRAVTLTHAVCLGVEEVEQGLFESLMGWNDSTNSGCSGCPVNQVSWNEATHFANLLSDRAGLDRCYTCEVDGEEVSDCQTAEEWGDVQTCPGYRLPTEAEWEYAARAGSGTAFTTGGNLVEGDESNCDDGLTLDDGSLLEDYAWYCASSGGKTRETGMLRTNDWGLHDIHGNVSEWCHDAYTEQPPGGTEDPVVTEESAHRVNRGGSYASYPHTLRLARRNYDQPWDGSDRIGFRIARTDGDR